MGNLLGCFLTNESGSTRPALASVVKAFLIYLNKYVTHCVVSESKWHSLVVLMDQTRTETYTTTTTSTLLMYVPYNADSRMDTGTQI